MFWIGMITGAITIVLASGLWLLYCMKVTGTSFDDFQDCVYVVEAALENRESEIQVWHNGECIESATLLEN